MVTKTVCAFCAKSHRVRPRLCKAKDRVMADLLKTMEPWLAIKKIENGLIDLDWLAQKYLKPIRRKRIKKGRKH